MRQSTSSIRPSSGSISKTCKRKRADDDTGLLLNSDAKPQISKRQKFIPHCNKSNAGGSRKYMSRDENVDEESDEGESEGSKWIDSRGHHPGIHTNHIRQTTKESKVAQKYRVDVSDRKRYFMYTPDDALKEKMKEYVKDVYKLFGAIHKSDDCMLHRSPPPARNNGRPIGVISCGFVWKDSSGKQHLKVNFGIVALIVKRKITEDQMKGYVERSWHLSHLCGNWTCCNWRHMTVECGRTNVSRNKCFRSARSCSHKPPCMKHRKRRFPVTVDISNHIRSAIKSTSSEIMATAGFESFEDTDADETCELCGKAISCCGSQSICRSLTLLTKSREILEKLESCTWPITKVRKAIRYLKDIVADLRREKRARQNGL